MSGKNRAQIYVEGNKNTVIVQQKNRRGWLLQLFFGSGDNDPQTDVPDPRKWKRCICQMPGVKDDNPCTLCNGSGWVRR
jgi:hypothetical protein